MSSSVQPPKPLGISLRDLLLELKRSSGGNSTNYVLPAYNDALVQTCLDDLNDHLQDLEDQVTAVQQQQTDKKSAPMSVRPSLLLKNAAIQRYKRGLLAYHQFRLNSIQDQYWRQGNNNAATNTNENLSPLEQEFQQDYHKLVLHYGSDLDLDLHSLPAPPLPQDRVQVRVVRDDVFLGRSIALESGASVTFNKGSTHYMLYSDVEEYLQQGYLELLEGEEQDM
jgi:GINS complex subunit 1